MAGNIMLKELVILKSGFRNLILAKHLSTRAQVQEKKYLKSLDEMPGPKTLPVIGNLMNIKNFGKCCFVNLVKRQFGLVFC
jgi:hypothetical protein